MFGDEKGKHRAGLPSGKDPLPRPLATAVHRGASCDTFQVWQPKMCLSEHYLARRDQTDICLE